MAKLDKIDNRSHPKENCLWEKEHQFEYFDKLVLKKNKFHLFKT